jgi:hypothetical protein
VRPIAGTIKRGQNKKEDENNEKTLMKDEKELSEHRMLVDLGRNDIHRISKTGTSLCIALSLGAPETVPVGSKLAMTLIGDRWGFNSPIRN